MGSEVIIVPILFIGLPWLIFHYMTKWKTAKTLTSSDEQLLDELYEAARRLDDRLQSIERIMAAENPDWNRGRLSGLGREHRLLEQVEELETRTGKSFSKRTK